MNTLVAAASKRAGVRGRMREQACVGIAEYRGYLDWEEAPAAGGPVCQDGRAAAADSAQRLRVVSRVGGWVSGMQWKMGFE